MVEIIGQNEIPEEELTRRFYKKVPDSPIEPMKIVNNSERFKIKWSGLVSKLISLKK